jgi:hypothetical protein
MIPVTHDLSYLLNLAVEHCITILKFGKNIIAVMNSFYLPKKVS